MFYDVAYQLLIVHALGKLRFDIVARLGLHAAEIGVVRRPYSCRDEEAQCDQIGSLRGADDAL